MSKYVLKTVESIPQEYSGECYQKQWCELAIYLIPILSSMPKTHVDR